MPPISEPLTQRRRNVMILVMIVITVFAVLLLFTPKTGNGPADTSPPSSPLGLQTSNAATATQPGGEPQSPAATETTVTPAAVAEPPGTEPAAVPDGDYLSVVGTVPLPGERLDQRLTFFFDEPITVEGADTPGAGPPFQMEPRFEGSYTVGTNYLDIGSTSFPTTGLLRVELSERIRGSSSGAPLNPAQRQFVFAPFVFAPLNVWTLETRENQEIVGLSFPTPVALDALSAALTVRTSDGENVPVQIEEADDPSVFHLSLPAHTKWPVTITVAKGLKDASAGLELRKDYSFPYPPRAVLAVERVDWELVEDQEQQVAVVFNREVSPEELADHLEIAEEATNAAVEYTVLTEEPALRHVVSMRLADPYQTALVLEFAAGLPGAQHSTLEEPAKRTLRARAREPQAPLMVQDQWWNEAGRDGLSLQLSFNSRVDVAQVRARLTTNPPLPNLRVEPSYSRNRVMIYGDWESRKRYELVIAAGMPYGEGQKLEQPLVWRVTADRVPPYLGFGHEGKYYFPRRGGVALPLESRNVTKVKAELHRMFPSNIAVAVDDMNDGSPWIDFLESWSESLSSKEIEVKTAGDRLAATPLDVDTFIPPDKLGVFALAVFNQTPKREQSEEDEEYYEEDYGRDYPSAIKLVLFTNIGLLTHWLDDELVVFAHNLYTLEPIPLARVTVYSRKNQVLITGNTDTQGMAHLRPFDKRLGLPGVIVVESGEDYTFLELEPRADETGEISIDLPRYDREAYDAFLYADRELYRPGEIAHLRWIVRTNYGDALPNVPLTFKIIKPNEQELLSGPVTLSARGTGGMDVVTQKAYPTGKYRAELLVPGAKQPIGTYAFSLEEFVPNRMKATVTLADERWLAGQPHSFTINAQHLFGAPASDRKTEAKIILKPARFSPEPWKAYTFGNDSEFKAEVIELGEAQTDEAGKAAYTFQYTPKKSPSFPLQAVALGRVFELGGRAVAGIAETTLFPSDLCLGITAATPAGGKGVEAHVAAVRPDGSVAPLSKVNVTLEKQVWSYYVRRYYNYHQPNWSESFEVVETREVPLTDGKGSTTFSFHDYGYYRVRVHADETPQFSTLSFYSYGGDAHVVDAARPSLIKLTLDKPDYQIGEEAQVRIEAPFDGKGFVVLQGQEIQRITTVEISNGVGVARFMVTREQYPNVWVEATVVHAIKEGKEQVYPFSSFALASLKVVDPERLIRVAFPTLPEEIRPAGEARFVVETKDSEGRPASVEVTLAAVDEGIHSITGYKSPDPLAYLSRDRRADYRRAHYYDKVAYDFEKTEIGGDIEALLGRRASAIDENWIKPVALWSGAVQTGADGRATVTMQVPEFTGQLRLVAVAASEKAVGAQTGHLYVRRPYTLRTSMPRFLLPNDKATCRAVVFNNSDKAAKAIVGWSTSGALESVSGSKELEVASHAEASALVEFEAAEAVGQGAILWTAEFRDAQGKVLESLSQPSPIPVRPPAAYQSHHELVVLKPGESYTARNSRFLDDARTELEVSVGANPQLRLYQALKYVVGYPYGCVEQTTSRLMPMYLLRQAADLTEIGLEREETIENYVQIGINRLFSMQTESGGLGFWPGAQDASPYSSIYALHFLTLVKNGRAFNLPEANFAALQKYVRGLSRDWSDASDSALFQRAYAVYVLALGGDTEAIEQIRRFDALNIPRAARYLLAAALAQNTRDHERVKMYLNTTPSKVYSLREPDRTFNSEVRNTAVELIALQQIGADPVELSAKAAELTAFLEEHHHGTTQETAFIVSALSAYLGSLSGQIETAAATIQGPQGTAEIRGKQHYRGKHEGAGGQFVVSNTGGADLYVNITTRGVPAEPEKEVVTEGMSIERQIYLANGEGHSGASYRQTDNYVIGLKLACQRPVQYLVVADLIPAGFEIENPRLESGATPNPAFEDGLTPSYLEIRDDRLVAAFDSLDQGEHRFFYVVRAVTPGAFQYPALEAECMYDASVRARTLPTSIEVTAR